MEEVLKLEQDGAVARITIDRPDRGNMLTLEMLDQVSALIIDAGFDPAIKVISITSVGDDFCLGRDPQSAPDKKPAPYVEVALSELIQKGVPAYDQAIFVNVTKSKGGDSYSDLRGFKLIDVLESAGLTGEATSVDIISLDGYMMTFSIEQLRRSYRQAAPVMVPSLPLPESSMALPVFLGSSPFSSK